MNWRSRPLISHDVVVILIGATKTRSGLAVKARLDKRKYPLGTVVPDETMDALHLKRHEFHGEWNYTLTPETL